MQYVGADVDITNVVCSVMTNAGRVKETFVVPSTPAGMDELIEKMGDKRKWKVLFESSTYSTDLHIYLMGLGVQTYTANAYSLKVINASRKKTDRNDSIALARYLRPHRHRRRAEAQGPVQAPRGACTGEGEDRAAHQSSHEAQRRVSG